MKWSGEGTSELSQSVRKVLPAKHEVAGEEVEGEEGDKKCT